MGQMLRCGVSLLCAAMCATCVVGCALSNEPALKAGEVSRIMMCVREPCSSSRNKANPRDDDFMIIEEFLKFFTGGFFRFQREKLSYSI